MESSKRSLLKTATWYVAHIVMATAVAFLITHDIKIAATIASAEIVWESALFFGHERAWAKFGHKVK